jgi:uncharacterized protein YdeI (YjbR/CyaY-like superfamily)
MTRAIRNSSTPGKSADEPKRDNDAQFFETADDLRRWFLANHDTADELWVGLYKVGSGRTSITWPEVVDEALCFGWIDGIRHRIDDMSYRNRLTPRRKGSNWSAINIGRVAELEAAGRMAEAGRRAFGTRDAIARRETPSRSEESR